MSLLFCDECGASVPLHATYCPYCHRRVGDVSGTWAQGYAPASQTISVPALPDPPSTQSHTLMPGDFLQYRYRIIKRVGQGGFAVVYQAHDYMNYRRSVAIKQINLSSLSSRDMIEATDTYNRELQLLSQLSHPNLPRIHDHFTDTEHWYVVMDYIGGKTLDDYMEERHWKRLSAEKVNSIAAQLCDVLEYLHSRQPPVIFRDLKPANIMLTPKGRVYLIDFGIARRYNPHKNRDTGQLGSPGYAAPEQYGKAQTTIRSDIYSLGATLQTLLTGKEPLELRVSHNRQRLLRHIPSKTRTLLQQMLDADPEQRPATMEEVKARLSQKQKNAFTYIMSTIPWFPGWSSLFLSGIILLFILPIMGTSIWGWYIFLSLCILVARLTLGLPAKIADFVASQENDELRSFLKQRFEGAIMFIFLLTLLAFVYNSSDDLTIDGTGIFVLHVYRFIFQVAGIASIIAAVTGLALLIRYVLQQHRLAHHNPTQQHYNAPVQHMRQHK